MWLEKRKIIISETTLKLNNRGLLKDRMQWEITATDFSFHYIEVH